MVACKLSYCKNTVEADGETCSFDCYARWIHSHPRLENQMLILAEGETIPLPIYEQPWYTAELERHFG